MDDFLAFAPTLAAALQLRERVAAVLTRLGLERHPTKGFWEPCQRGEHLGLLLDTEQGTLSAPPSKLEALSRLARGLLQRAARNSRWVPVRELSTLAGKAQFLHLAILPARFYLRELYDVLSTRDGWGGRVRLTRQLARDLQWWVSVPTRSNGRSIFRPVESAYLHCDSSSYGWGAVLNEQFEARGFWPPADMPHHITWKELKAVRLAVQTFLPRLRGRQVLLHEDNQAVCYVLTGLTSRSPEMMAELRRLWYLLDSNDIRLRPRYIQSAANYWADALSRHLDRDDWRLDPSTFAYLEALWGPHSIDRFATALNALLPRYNSRWADPGSEAVDAMHLSDSAWRAERNWCNPPWPLLPQLVLKLRQSGAAATVVAPHWPAKPWYRDLVELATDCVLLPRCAGLFTPGRPQARDRAGPAAWPAVAFRLPARPGFTYDGADSGTR